MTDAEFAALRERLLRRQAEPGVPAAHRGDVLDLLAELGRLRKPPDVSGLMPAAELAAVRGRLAENWPAAHDPAALWDAWHADFLALLAHAEAADALARELYGVVADLHADDPGRQALLERGRAEGREQAAQELERLAGVEDGLSADNSRRKAAAVRALGPVRPPPPPQEAEREAERLREALRQCLERLEWASERDGLSPLHFAHAIDAARAALGEDAP